MDRSLFPVSLADARGQTLTLTVPPRRVVSLVPSLTELLAYFSLDESVVGLTRFCTRPAAWKARKQIVGGTKNVHLDRVRALVPDLVLANLEENTREDVEALEREMPVFVTDVCSVPAACEMIRQVGRLTGCALQADSLASEIDAGFAGLAAPRPPLRAAYLIWRDPYMTVGHDTFIHDVLARGGFLNAFGDQTRYPAVTPEDLMAAHLDVLLLASEPFPFQEKHLDAVRAFLPKTPLRIVDGELFSWYGARLLYTPAYLERLHRELVC